MSTVVAILLVIISLGMLIAYYIGFTVGHRDGYAAGHNDGKREGSVRAYAVGYDRGRHNRQASEAAAAADSEESTPRINWVWPIVVSLIVIVVATLALGR